MYEQNSRHFADDIFKGNVFSLMEIMYFDKDFTKMYP